MELSISTNKTVLLRKNARGVMPALILSVVYPVRGGEGGCPVLFQSSCGRYPVLVLAGGRGGTLSWFYWGRGVSQVLGQGSHFSQREPGTRDQGYPLPPQTDIKIG